MSVMTPGVQWAMGGSARGVHAEVWHGRIGLMSKGLCIKDPRIPHVVKIMSLIPIVLPK